MNRIITDFSESFQKNNTNGLIFSLSLRIAILAIIVILENYFIQIKDSLSTINSTLLNTYNGRKLNTINNLVEIVFKEKKNATICEYYCSSKNSICIEKNKNYDSSEKMIISKILYLEDFEKIFEFDKNDNYSFSNLKESLTSLKKMNQEVLIKCICLPGYVTYFDSYNEIKNYCNYKQKLSIIAAALEIVFGFGIGHIYAERIFFGLGKFFFSTFIWVLLMFIEGILMNSNNDKMKILSKIFLIMIRSWQFIDFFLFYFKIYYKDGNGVSLF